MLSYHRYAQPYDSLLFFIILHLFITITLDLDTGSLIKQTSNINVEDSLYPSRAIKGNTQLAVVHTRHEEPSMNSNYG